MKILQIWDDEIKTILNENKGKGQIVFCNSSYNKNVIWKAGFKQRVEYKSQLFNFIALNGE